MGGSGSGKSKAEILKLDGTEIDKYGKVTKGDFFNFLKLPADHMANLEKTMSAEQALAFKNHVVRMKVGTSAMIPMICGAAACPMRQCPFHTMKNWPAGEQCHPPGTYIKTANHGDVKIEDLDPEEHKVISFHRKKQRVMSNWNNGYNFSISLKEFHGNIVDVSMGSHYYKATPGHICVARFNEKSINKFCVYLMRKGNHWRIGKSRVCSSSGKENKYHMPFANRGKNENADAMWILGVYNLNTEALLAEEYFSVTWGISKVCFADSLNKCESKYDGLYKWVTKEQINKHYESLIKEESFYREKLRSLNLSIDYPIWSKNNTEKTVEDIKLFPRQLMFIRACNLISEIMDIAIYPTYKEDPMCSVRCEWFPIKVKYESYTGRVYSLDVKNDHKTYFANNIATHNCPIEANLVAMWIKSYVEDIGVDPDNRTEMVLVNKLVECDMIDYRANIGLSKDEDGWTLMKTDFIENEGGSQEVKSASPLLEIKDRNHNARMKVLESFSVTRREKAKKAAMLKQRDEGDIGAHWAEMKKFAEAFKKNKGQIAINKIQNKAQEDSADDAIEADWETIDI